MTTSTTPPTGQPPALTLPEAVISDAAGAISQLAMDGHLVDVREIPTHDPLVIVGAVLDVLTEAGVFAREAEAERRGAGKALRMAGHDDVIDMGVAGFLFGLAEQIEAGEVTL